MFGSRKISIRKLEASWLLAWGEKWGTSPTETLHRIVWLAKRLEDKTGQEPTFENLSGLLTGVHIPPVYLPPASLPVVKTEKSPALSALEDL